MTRLYLHYNQIGEINALVGLADLSVLYLDHNQISDIGPLVSNVDFGSGDYVDLRSNPLNEDSICDHVPALEARGVTVDWTVTECPEPAGWVSLLVALATLGALARGRRTAAGR